MKKFQFKLKPVERHRKLIEQEKQRDLSVSIAALRKTEAKLYEIDENEVKGRRAYAALGEIGSRESLTSGQFWVIDSFVQGQKVRRAEAKKILEQQDKQVQACYAEFVKARQNLRVIETLRDKQFADYKQKLRRYEAKVLDDVYTLRHRLDEAKKGNGNG